jgi:TolB-like protein/DNA-binding winged helix-turn-helix (wHTH) protein
LADTFSVNGVSADLANETLTDASGTTIELRPQCFAVLRSLLAKPNQLVTKNELMQAVWPGTAVTDDSLVQCIHEIRQALRDEERTVLKTVPKRGYRLVLPEAVPDQPAAAGGQAVVDPAVVPPPAAAPLRWPAARRLAAAATVLVLVGAALWLWLIEHRPGARLDTATTAAVAVLPFAALSGDTARSFADGITEDVITDLAKLAGISVVARDTRADPASLPAAVAQVARELGLRYVLVGSVRRDGDRVRVNAHLIDAVAGHHLWAERYDARLDDALALEDRLARSIVSALATKLVKAEPAKDAPAPSTEVAATDPAAVPTNRPPTAVVFANAVFSLPAKGSTAAPIRVADLIAVDDGLGTNVFSLSGDDAPYFEIVGRSLYLKAGVPLDVANKGSYNLTVAVDDRSVGAEPDATEGFTLRLIQAADQSGGTRLD